MSNSIGIVVWGIRNGFRNNWISTPEAPEVYAVFTDEMRQFCNSVINPFYSIEKTLNHTIVSIYNPNSKDHVQRKAYVAISLVIPNGAAFSENIRPILDETLSFYTQKQGNAGVNMLSIEQLQGLFNNVSLVKKRSGKAELNGKLALFNYGMLNSIDDHLSSPFIHGYQKVYFSGESNNALEKIPGIQTIDGFITPVDIHVPDFSASSYKISHNGVNIENSSFEAKPGDVIQFLDRKTNKGKQLQVTNENLTIYLSDLFPNIVDYEKPAKARRKKRLIVFSVLLSIIGGLAVLGWMQLNQVEEGSKVSNVNIHHEGKDSIINNKEINDSSLVDATNNTPSENDSLSKKKSFKEPNDFHKKLKKPIESKNNNLVNSVKLKKFEPEKSNTPPISKEKQLTEKEKNLKISELEKKLKTTNTNNSNISSNIQALREISITDPGLFWKKVKKIESDLKKP